MLKEGPWNLTDLEGVEKNGLNVFSTFSCGGGSSMGYRLAGFNVIGCCEIDPAIFKVYVANHKPRFGYNKPVNWLHHAELPDELFNLDVLDGSPPCSSFSMAGSREKDWGKKKKFNEGQSKQILDDLFFDYIAVAKRLQPKIVVAENVKGLIAGKARGYVKQIFQGFSDAGYDTQLFLLNAARMGVPQKRERTFFIGRRRDLNLPKLKLSFTEAPVPIGKAYEGCSSEGAKHMTPTFRTFWNKMAPGTSFSKVHPKGSYFNYYKLHPGLPAPVFTASSGNDGYGHWKYPRWSSPNELSRVTTFPDDYSFGKQQPRFICAMSVPPYMMQRLASSLYKQLFSN